MQTKRKVTSFPFLFQPLNSTVLSCLLNNFSSCVIFTNDLKNQMQAAMGQMMWTWRPKGQGGRTVSCFALLLLRRVSPFHRNFLTMDQRTHQAPRGLWSKSSHKGQLSSPSCPPKAFGDFQRQFLLSQQKVNGTTWHLVGTDLEAYTPQCTFPPPHQMSREGGHWQSSLHPLTNSWVSFAQWHHSGADKPGRKMSHLWHVVT